MKTYNYNPTCNILKLILAHLVLEKTIPNEINLKSRLFSWRSKDRPFGHLAMTDPMFRYGWYGIFTYANFMAGQPTPPNVPPPRNNGLIRPY